MINPEQLLGKILSDTLGASMPVNGKKKKKKRTSGTGDLLGTVLSNPAALMTAIGLGVGAYEIYKDSKAGPAGTAGGTVPPGPGVPPPGGPAQATPPPPPPPPPGSAPAPAPAPAPEPAPPAGEQTGKQEGLGADTALRMIRVMIGAAHADGVLDESEEKAILEKLRGAELTQEEKMFLLDELHHPHSVAELTEGVDDPSTARALYMLAVATIDVDTEAERTWLDELGRALGLSDEVRGFIEEQVE